MSPTDATTLLRELRPTEVSAAPDDAALERLLLTEPEPPREPRRRRSGSGLRRPALAAGALALAVTAVFALGPVGDRAAPGIVERAAAAVSQPGTILHYRATMKWTGVEPRTIESWQTPGDTRERTLFVDSGMETVDDHIAKVSKSYVADRDEIVIRTDPSWMRPTEEEKPFPGDPGTGLAAGYQPWINTSLGDLTELLRSAEAGEGAFRLIGKSTVDGVRVDGIRISKSVQEYDFRDAARVVDPKNPPPTKLIPTTREVFLDERTALPVKVVDRRDGRIAKVIDYDVVEVLPHTQANDRLLELADHPGAKVTHEGPFR